MTDISTYTRSTAPPWAETVVHAIRADDPGKARKLWMDAAAKAGADHAIYAVAEPGPGQITVGEAPLVFGNPLRHGFAWRCGECLDTFRRGGPDPHAGVNYTTLHAASNAARKHSAEGHTGSVPVHEVTR
ncbi:hypothetical protein [Actinomadura decatromicini]|uniref:hypothetical protein n=1 Tax=Actinomadura decatromicini TaxID=2604572 RepID=UPI0016534057|nr:hypothetical protein [Actinomadura decatromicini]